MNSDWVEERIEPLARALCAARGIDPDYEVEVDDENRRHRPSPTWRLYRDQARDFLVMLEVAIDMDRAETALDKVAE